MLMSLANACCKLGLGIGSLSVVVLSSGCNSLDDYERPTENQARLVIPTDTRPVQHATKAPRPVSGGTLLVTRSGQFAVASDQDLDAVTVVDLASGRVHGVVQLSPGDEPGRLVEDQNGIVHFAGAERSSRSIPRCRSCATVARCAERRAASPSRQTTR
jgi:hypothetical protein